MTIEEALAAAPQPPKQKRGRVKAFVRGLKRAGIAGGAAIGGVFVAPGVLEGLIGIIGGSGESGGGGGLIEIMPAPPKTGDPTEIQNWAIAFCAFVIAEYFWRKTRPKDADLAADLMRGELTPEQVGQIRAILAAGQKAEELKSQIP